MGNIAELHAADEIAAAEETEAFETDEEQALDVDDSISESVCGLIGTMAYAPSHIDVLGAVLDRLVEDFDATNTPENKARAQALIDSFTDQLETDRYIIGTEETPASPAP